MNLLKSVKTPTLIACIAAVAIGLLILIWPVFILRFICILLALGLICIGGLRLMTYFKDTKKVGLPPLNLAIGLFLIVTGIAVIAENTQIIFLFPFLLVDCSIYTGKIPQYGVILYKYWAHRTRWSSPSTALCTCVLVGHPPVR